MPPHVTAPDLLVLHTLRCAGTTSLPRLASIARLPEPDVESELIDLAVAGLVTFLPGAFSGWQLTDVGHDVDSRRIATELDTTEARDTVRQCFDVFRDLNPQMLDVFTDWQLRAGAAADGPGDPIVEARILLRANDLDARARPLCSHLSQVLARFARYRERFDDALARVHAGSPEYLADTVDSYHVVWFQLHEDLLTTLARQRE